MQILSHSPAAAAVENLHVLTTNGGEAANPCAHTLIIPITKHCNNCCMSTQINFNKITIKSMIELHFNRKISMKHQKKTDIDSIRATVALFIYINK